MNVTNGQTCHDIFLVCKDLWYSKIAMVVLSVDAVQQSTMMVK